MPNTTIDSTTKGVFAIAPTPFTDNGAVDFASIDRLNAYYSEAGADGITILGLLGEAGKLGADEARTVAARFLSTANMPVIVGVSAPGFAAMRSLARFAMDNGAAGVMIAPPPNLRTDEQIVNYFGQAAEAVGTDIPFALQDYPLTLGVVISPSVIACIAREQPSCVMLKHEDWPGLDKISTLRAAEQDGAAPRLSILCGNGGLFLDFELERGADGAMTGYCFTDAVVAVVRASRAGDRELMHSIFDAHLPLIRYEQQPGIGLGVRKYVLSKRRIISTATQRNPASVLNSRGQAEVDYLLERLAAATSATAGV